MREASWYKMLIFSMILHFTILAAFSIPIKKSIKRMDLYSTYSVNLVGDLTGSTSGYPGENHVLSAGGSGAKREEIPSKKQTQKIEHKTKKKTSPIKKEPKAVSLSKKSLTVKKDSRENAPNSALTKDELNRLERRINELKTKTNYLDVTQMRGSYEGGGKSSGGIAGIQGVGLPVSGASTGRPLDPQTQKYIINIWERIKQAWGLPVSYSTKKDLESIVTVKIRKDGRIIDINFEKRSGNRFYDESILRAIRSIDPLPPIPPSFSEDTIEIGFRFLPGDIS